MKKELRLFPKNYFVFVDTFTQTAAAAAYVGFGDPDVEKYLDENNITVLNCIISFPLTKECAFQVVLREDRDYFYLPDIILDICNKYREIYAEEDATSSIKAANLPRGMNRNVTNGKWGIKYHYLDELILHDLVLETTTNTLTINYSTRPSPSHL